SITFWDMSNACPAPSSIPLPDPSFSPQTLGLVGNRVLAVPRMSRIGDGTFATIAIYGLESRAPIGQGLANQQVAGTTVSMISVGGGRALVVAPKPLLIDL